MITAKVTRPIFDKDNLENPKVTLTATVSHGLVTKELDLDLIVRRLGISNSQAVILDLSNITVPSIVYKDLDLPIVGTNGSEITWKSNKEEIVNGSGKVIRPDYDESDIEVILTATSKKGDETQTKTFTITVKAWSLVEEADDAKALVTWDLIKGVNINSQAITDNLVLPAIVGRNVAAKWTIASTTADPIIATGKLDILTGVVTRPTYTQGQVSVTIKCVLTKQTETREIVLAPFIIAPAAMTNQEILDSATTLLESSLFLGKDNASLTQITSTMQLPLRVNDVNAGIAKIEWSLVAYSTHTTVASSQYIVLTDTVSYKLATITRPSLSTGNIQIALKATITVGSSPSVLTNTKYFDMTIIAQPQ